MKQASFINNSSNAECHKSLEKDVETFHIQWYGVKFYRANPRDESNVFSPFLGTD